MSSEKYKKKKAIINSVKTGMSSQKYKKKAIINTQIIIT